MINDMFMSCKSRQFVGFTFISPKQSTFLHYEKNISESYEISYIATTDYRLERIRNC